MNAGYPSSWQSERSAFNHDELSNKYLPALERILSIAAGRSESAMSVEEACNNLAIWTNRSVEAHALLNRFETEMSPHLLFQSVPLCNCSEETKEWIVPLVHGLWMVRESVGIKITQASECLKRVDAAYSKALAALKKLKKMIPDPGAQMAIECLRIACRDLSTAISEFPSDIKVA